MTGTVAVVTDSTACLAPGLAARFEIHVVPLGVVLDGKVHDDTSCSSADVSAALRQGLPLTTSRPAPARFAEVYAAAAEAGAAGIVSVHLSGRMSGTVDSARLAAASAPVKVRVVDSASIGVGLGFAVRAAAAAARAGRPLEDVAAAAASRSARLRFLFCVAGIGYLRDGGRLGATAALLDSTLGVKPLLHIVDGQIVLLEKVRTLSRAMARLEQLAAEFANASDGAPVDVAVQHLADGERAAQLAVRLRRRIPGLRAMSVSEVGPAIAVHTGPGMLGVVVAPD